MCGVVGIVSRSPVNQQIYDALITLQHRGQDAAGMVTWDDRRLQLRKGNGLVREVFEARHMRRLGGTMGIGHVRYPTAGTASAAEAQPMYVNVPYGVSLAHNGNLVNVGELQQRIHGAHRHMNTESDSEILLNVFAHQLQSAARAGLDADTIFKAMRRVYGICRGAFAAVAMINGYGIVAFRDPNGIRPLVLGERTAADGSCEAMVASESAALDILGFSFVRDVAPGEVICIDRDGCVASRICAPRKLLTGHAPCIFEYVYLAREDSVIDKISVYRARQRMGAKLAELIRSRYPGEKHGIELVMPIPESSRSSALELAATLAVPYGEGFVKNRYIGRTFIMPGQSQRQKSVRRKLNAIGDQFCGKSVLLVEDSIVRGTTTRRIVEQARRAGASRVFMAVAAPPVRHPNVYGIDMPTADELIAYGRTEEQVAREIGVDWLVYQRLDDLIAVAGDGNKNLSRFECSVFDGHYVTGDVDADYLQALSAARSDTSKQHREAERNRDAPVLELHNHA